MAYVPHLLISALAFLSVVNLALMLLLLLQRAGQHCPYASAGQSLAKRPPAKADDYIQSRKAQQHGQR